MPTIPASVIASRIIQLAEVIDNDYQGKDVVFVGVLNGSVVFLSDVLRSVTIDPEIDFIKIHSYEGTEQKELHVHCDLTTNVTGRHVLIVEDIVDSGRTILKVIDLVQRQNPASIEVLCLLYRERKSELATRPKYIGYGVPEGFFVGYGLDMNGKGRGLSYLKTLVK